MEPLEFLGGKYQEPVGIVPGEVQTFRARERASGRTVFIHRISTVGTADPHQSELLRLLLVSLFRSTSAKQQILDFSEQPGCYYVVTDSSPQCLLLREWLQFEIDHASAPGRELKAAVPVVELEPVTPSREHSIPYTPPQLPSSTLIRPSSLEPRPGNYPAVAASAGNAVPKWETAPVAPPNVPSTREFPNETPQIRPPVPAPAPAPPKPEGGEFTRFFVSETVAPAPVPPVQGPPAAFQPSPRPIEPLPAPVVPASQPGGGEFTRFFTGGMPPSAPPPPRASEPVWQPPAAPVTPPPPRSTDRPSNPGGLVQRPNTPPPPQLRAEPGEFTKMFSKSAIGGGPAAAPPESRPYTPPTPAPPAPRNDRNDFGFNNPRLGQLPDLSNQRSDLDRMFDSAPEVPSPMPSASQTPGEYTQMFGKGAVPPPIQPPSSVAARPLSRLNDPYPEPAQNQAAAPAVPSGPGEFTRVIQGNRPLAGVDAGGFPPAAGKQGAAAGGAPASGGPSPVQLNINPINPMMAMGSAMHVPGAAAGMGGAGSVNAGMGNPMMGGGLGHASAMSPVGSAHMSGPTMQSAMQAPGSATHPHASGGHEAVGHAGAPKLPKMPGQLPKAPTVGMADRTKLIILFSVLALLVVVMILFVIFSGHK